MKWYSLSFPQWALLIVLVAITDAFTWAQKYFLPELVRPFTFLLFGIAMILAFFFLVHPEDPALLAKTLCLVLTAITLVLVLVQDVILVYQVSWKTIVILVGAVIDPFIAGYLYSAFRPRK